MTMRTRLHRKRKAQITVFMIVGIILLFSSALLFYIRDQIAGGIPDEFVPVAEEVPLEAQPIKVFVEDCVKKVGREALVQVGLHGGYVQPDDMTMSGTAFLVGLEPTESDGILLLGEDSLVPYWWYLETSNTCSGNCRFSSLMPPLRKTEGQYSIESQMDLYIDRELTRCLDDFRMFREQGFDITVLGDVKTDTRVTERDVALIVEYPIRVVREGRTIDITQFFTKLDVNLTGIYEFARMVSDKEAQSSFLETHTMNVIAMYSIPTSMGRLPPIAEFTMDPNDFMFWTRTKAQQQLEENALPYSTSMLQIDQARNFKRMVMFKKDSHGVLKYDPIGTALMDKTILRLDKNFTSLEARFTYLDWWPIYLNINDREVLMPTSVDVPLLSWLGINQYVFIYSVAYPVLVTLKDPDAFAGEGYEFMFALEENIRYNQPINMSNNVTVFNQEQGTLVCSPNQRQGSPVNIEVKDKMTGGPVKDVRVMVQFGKESCHVGMTEIGADNRSVIGANIPAGLGEIRASQMDYLDYSGTLVSAPELEQNITIEMMPYRYLNVSVFSRPLVYQSYRYILPSNVPLSSLSPKERFLFVFERKADDGSEYTAYVTGIGSNMATIKMIPGKYEVRGYLILNETIRIPAEEKEYDGSIFGSSKPVKLNETIMDQWQEGGIMLDNETGYFEVTQEDLFGSKKLNLYVLRFPLPMTHSTEFNNAPSIEQAGQLTEYSNIYRTALEPEWVK